MQTREKNSKKISEHKKIENIETAQAAEGKPRHVAAGSGSANNGSNLGVSVLNSNSVLSDASPRYGSALASDDPTDTIPDGTVAA